MSNQFLKLRRSAVPGRVPSTSSIDFGEIALNTFDGLAFIKRSGSNGEEVITLGSREGAFTGSFSGSFIGNGAGLFNVPASGIVGLNLSQIATGSVSASVGVGAASFNVVSASNSLLYVSSSGNIGVNTTSPTAKIHISGSGTDSLFRIQSPFDYNGVIQSNIVNVNGRGEVGIGSTPLNQIPLYVYRSGYGELLRLGSDANTIGFSNGEIYIGSAANTKFSPGELRLLNNAGNAIIRNSYSGPSSGISLIAPGNIILTPGTFDGSGNVGINTTSPTAKLDVSGSSRFIGNMVITGSGNTSATNALSVVNSSNSSLLFVRNDGNVGIGTNTPLNTLHINGTARVDYIYMPTGFGSFGAGGGITIYADYIYREGYSATIARTLSLKANAGINFVSNNTGQTAFLWQEDYATSTLYMTYGNDRSVTVGSNLTHTSSIFTIDSRTKGFLAPRMTAAQRLAIATPAQGLIVYDTGSATEGLWLYNSGSTPGWQQVLTNSGSQSISGSITVNNVTVTGTLTAQTIVAQTITSSTDYVSGSTIFGNSLSNTHQFTGSVSITGSLRLPYLTDGSVLFISGGAVSQNNSIFFWDNAQGRLGIGTNAPTHRLQVSGNTILTNPPSYQLRLSDGTFKWDLWAVANITNTDLRFVDNSGNTVMVLYNGGNVSIGNNSNNARLSVSGTTFLSGSVTGSDMLIRGSGNTSATNALIVQNSSAAQALSINNAGQAMFGTNAPAAGIKLETDGAFRAWSRVEIGQFGALTINTTQITKGASGSDLFEIANSSAHNAIAGTYYALQVRNSVNPTSGNAVVNGLVLNLTINQTGGANGITRGLYVNPTLTANADFRAIEWSNNASGSTSWGLYGAGSAPNYLSGSLGIGTTVLGNATKLTIGGIETAVSSIARGQLINTALTASANLDTLIGLDIAPTFASGGFGTITNIGIRSTVGGGTAQTPTFAAQFINNTNAFGNNGVFIQASHTTDSTYALLINAAGANNTFSIRGNRYLWYNGGNAYFGNFANAAARVHIRGGASEPSLIVEDSFATSSFQVQANRNVLIGSTSDSGHRLQVYGNTFISGALDILDAEINYQRNNNVTTGSARLIASIPTASLNAAFFDYVIVSGSNARAGTVTSVWASSSVEWNETYTNDIGSTTDVSLYAAITGSSIGLFATSSINNIWTIKSLIRTI